jgi:hypothetical protein
MLKGVDYYYIFIIIIMHKVLLNNLPDTRVPNLWVLRASPLHFSELLTACPLPHHLIERTITRKRIELEGIVFTTNNLISKREAKND